MSDATDIEDEPQALPGDGLRDGIVDELRSDLGDKLIDTYLVPQDDLWVRVAPDAWAAAAASLKAHGFDYFCYISAIDWLPSPFGKGEDDHDAEPTERDTEIVQGYTGGESRFQMLARVTDLERHVGVTLKADVPDTMTMPTWIPSYAGANWHERETHEMFGIGFDGHPDLRNLYLPGEFEGFPLRKDFPLLSRMVKPWPGIVDIEPMPAQDDEPDAPKADDTAAGDAVEGATESSTDAEAPPTDTDESADATVVDTPPTDDAAAPAADADAEATGNAVDAADASPDAVDPAGEPATGPVADTITSDGTPSGGEDTDSDDHRRPGADGTVEADLEPGTTTESTDADAEAPTPGPATAEHPDGLTGGDTENNDRIDDRNDDRNDEDGAS